MTGSIRSYFIYIFAFMILVLGGASWLLKGISFDSSQDASINFYEGGLILAMVICRLHSPFFKNKNDLS